MLDLFIVRYTGIPARVIRAIDKSSFSKVGDEVVADWLGSVGADGTTGYTKLLFNADVMRRAKTRRGQFLSLSKQSKQSKEAIALLLMLDVQERDIVELDNAAMLKYWNRGVNAGMLADIVRNGIDAELLDSLGIVMESRRIPFSMMMRRQLA